MEGNTNDIGNKKRLIQSMREIYPPVTAHDSSIASLTKMNAVKRYEHFCIGKNVKYNIYKATIMILGLIR